jgi:SAM-dependent MidA family methyltransferase
MNSVALDLPAPAESARLLSNALLEKIDHEIGAAGGWLDFERYMELCLYAPGLGYYSAGATKLGEAGDFITAPELSPLFGHTLAQAMAGWLGQLRRPVILELGAGSGSLAAAVLERLAQLQQLPVEYQILDISADFRERQQLRLRDWGDRVRWLDRLPAAPFEGLVLANEVLDALPVARFVKAGRQVIPLGVGRGESGLGWARGAADPGLAADVADIEAECKVILPDGYSSELSRRLPAWLAALAQNMGRGAMLFVDYGFSRRDYYRPERSGGTLMCHYRHRAHDNPFVWPGLQDLTAWVDFSRVAMAAQDCGLAVSGFTTQAEFLMQAGIGDLMSRTGDEADALRQAAALKTLLLPGEMGERFKVMLLTRGLAAATLPGRDFRSRL